MRPRPESEDTVKAVALVGGATLLGAVVGAVIASAFERFVGRPWI